MFVSVWFLVVSASGASGMVSYSPPLESLQDCQRLSAEMYTGLIYGRTKMSCIQVRTYLGERK